MAFVSDSRYRGYLGPNPPPAPSPLEGDAWEDFLHDIVAGITGLDPTLVFPRWQQEPPVHPPITVTWAAVGTIRSTSDWQPAVLHVSGTEPDITTMYDAFQRMQTSTVTATFYGPQAEMVAGLLRDGLFIAQNIAELRRNAVTIVEAQDLTRSPDLFRQQWIDRTDLEMVFRREIRRNYPVLNIVRAQGNVIANPPFLSPRVIATGFDTDLVPQETIWDGGVTDWDDGNTKWDLL